MVPALLFIILGVSMLFPLNGSAPGELYWAAGTILLFVFTRIRYGNNVFVPKSTHLLFMLSFAALAVSAIVSLSPALSIVASIRFAEAYMMFIVGAAIGNNEARSVFPKGVIRVSQWAISVFLLLLFVRPLAELLPSANNLTALAGHHPAAYVLIFFLPLMASWYYSNRGLVPLAWLALMGISLTLTFSRGALVMTTAWLSIELFRARFSRSGQAALLSIACIVLSLLSAVYWISTLPYAQRADLADRHPTWVLFLKEPTSDTLRIAYLREAISGVLDRPILGNGPGTFGLVSRKFAREPATYSNHAHSLPMETLSDLGGIGALPFFFLLLTIGRHAWRQGQRAGGTDRALALGVVLLLLYSIFEVTLNTLPAMMLFYATGGYLSGKHDASVRTRMPIYVLLLLWLYAVSFLSSAVLQLNRAPAASFLAAPYRKDRAIAYLTSSPTDDAIPRSLIHGLYRLDPDIQYLLATEKPEPAAAFMRVFTLDQYNYSFRQGALTVLWNAKQYDNLPPILCQLATFAGTHFPCDELDDPLFLAYLQHPSFAEALGHLSGKDGLAKFLYLIGLTYHDLTGDIQLPLLFWRSARDSAPQWGHYHLELASGQLYWQYNPTASLDTLEGCMLHPLAKKGCKPMYESLTSLYPPGSLRKDIEAIPIHLAP